MCRKLGIAKWPYRRKEAGASRPAPLPASPHAQNISLESLTKMENEDSRPTSPAEAVVGGTNLGAENDVTVACELRELGSLAVADMADTMCADTMCGVSEGMCRGTEMTRHVAHGMGWSDKSASSRGMTWLLRDVAAHQVSRMCAGEAGAGDASGVCSRLCSLLALLGEGNAPAQDGARTMPINEMHDGRGVSTPDTLACRPMLLGKGARCDGGVRLTEPRTERPTKPAPGGKGASKLMSPQAAPWLPRHLVGGSAPLPAMSARGAGDAQGLFFENKQPLSNNHSMRAPLQPARESPAQPRFSRTSEQPQAVARLGDASGLLLPPLNQALLSSLT